MNDVISTSIGIEHDTTTLRPYILLTICEGDNRQTRRFMPKFAKLLGQQLIDYANILMETPE